jgi:ABC-2 type transport system permease protein
VRLSDHGAPPAAWASPALPALPGWPERVVSGVSKMLAVAEVEVRKLRHDPSELVTRAVQPALWLLVFGQVVARMRAIPSGGLSYLDFLAPGILAQSVLFTAIFAGMAIIWERDLGVTQKYLTSPTPRAALVAGKALAAGARGLVQGVFIYLLALLLGVRLNWNPLAILGVALFVLLGGVVFSGFSMVIACAVKSRERFMGIGQVMTMPLFFASNAVYPNEVMPAWLQVISHLNPLTYEVDGLRALMLTSGASAYGLGFDYLVLLVVACMLILLGAQLYPNVVR